MELKDLICIFIASLLFISLVSSKTDSNTQNTETIHISLEMLPNFTNKQMISFNYTLTSETETKIEYTPFVRCKYIASFSTYLNKTLDNEPFKDRYIFTKVDETWETQQCSAGIKIISPIIIQKAVYFNITKNPIIETDLKFCKDRNCNKKSTLFLLGETAYIKAEARDKEGNSLKADFEGNYIIPNLSSYKLKFSGNIASFKTNKKGEYSISVQALKEGYDSITKSSFIRVTDSYIKTQTPQEICKINGKCERARGETKQNCPLDCKKGKSKILPIIIISIIFLSILFIVLIIKKRKGKNEQIQ